MIKQTLIAIVLLSIVIGNNWDAEAAHRTVQKYRNVRNTVKVREPRFISDPIDTFITLINTISGMFRLYVEQKNETDNVLINTYDIVADGFNDTYMSTKRPTTTTTIKYDPDSTPPTTTERYRITRKELGYILGRNYRGLKKLLNIEWNDAINQSKYNIMEYQVEKAHSLAKYVRPTGLPPPKIIVNTIEG